MNRTCVRALVAVMFLGLLSSVFAQTTGQINYQARLLDAYGRRVNGTVSLTFRIYDAATAGNLLWQETQTGVVIQDGLYSVLLGAKTPVPASVFAGNNVYLELKINNETLKPRQKITATAHALVSRTVMGNNLYEHPTSGNVGVGTKSPAAKLDVAGTVKASGFRMPTGASAGYVLTSDGSGAGSWRAVSAVVTETDPVHTNWVRVAFAPATNNIWNAIGARALASDVATATNDLWGAVNARVLAATYSAATNDLWAAVNGKVPLEGGVMTGPLTNEHGFYGNGAGLTNIPTSGFDLTNYVEKTGSEMSGALVVNNDLTVGGKTVLTPGEQTISDNATPISVAQTFSKIGTSDGSLKDFGDCALQVEDGTPGQMLVLQATNGWVKFSQGKGVSLVNGVEFSMSTNDTLHLIYNGSVWVELSRGDNDPILP